LSLNLKIAINLLILFVAPWSQAITLEQIYQAAVENTAVIKDKQYSEEIAKQQENQAIGGVLPTLAAVSTNTWRDPVLAIGPFGEPYQHFGAINLTQPIFQGGAEYYAIKNAQKLPEIAKLQRMQEELGLYTLVSQAFYQAVRNQQEQQVYLEQKKTLTERVKALQQRARIGRSKQTDVLAARSQLARVTAELSKVEQQMIAAKKALKNLSGLEEIPNLTDNSEPEELSLASHWEKQLMEVPIIKANKLLVENARRDIEGARGSFLPSVDMDANYFVDRAGILQDSKWEVTVNARWEVFSGGRDASQVRIKKLEALQLDAQLTDLKRNLQNDFKSLREEFIMHKKILSEMKEAVALAKENYQQHMLEANQGLVSDLEALRVLEEYLQVRRTYDQQVFDLKLTWTTLRALAGEHP
jgi:outer membrane protein